MDPLTIFLALPEPVRQILIGAAGDVLANVLRGVWSGLTNKDVAPAFARIYKRWADELPAEEPKILETFQDFFSRDVTRREFEKIPLGRYEEIDFDALELEFRVSCRAKGAAPPTTDLYQLLDIWVRDLDKLLEAHPQHRQPLEKAIRDLNRGEAEVLNDSLAARLYLKAPITATSVSAAWPNSPDSPRR
ncbi:MAG: hypothetical protein KIT09_00965 [Bryobacteraceae bacterium]|nr:hypothetical protein [Bryobacteraceae bacterium]